MTLQEQSRAAHEHASQAAQGRGPEWNRRYVDALERQGFALHSLGSTVVLGPDGPLMAPQPCSEGWQYPYPSVVAPKDWKLAVAVVLTVRELIDLLATQPPEAPAYVGTNCHGCFEPAASVRLDPRGMVVIEDAE